MMVEKYIQKEQICLAAGVQNIFVFLINSLIIECLRTFK